VAPLSKSQLEAEDSMPKIFLFYDFESVQRIHDAEGQLIHQPNLCVIRGCCSYCWDSEAKDRVVQYCEFCCAVDKTFYGFGACKDLIAWLFVDFAKHISAKKKGLKMKKIKIILIAHNAKAYDAQFILKHCISCRFTPNVIKIGTKILQMNINQFTFIDSLSFLQMPLKRMPFTFGFEDSVLKGDFPHLFNSE